MLVLAIFLLVKLLWLIVTVIWLPSSGIDHEKKVGGKSLYYRVKLTPNGVIVPVIKKPIKLAGSIKDIKLIAVYNASDTTVVTIEHKKKTKILGRGDEINGFVLTGGGSNYATFSKDAKAYRVDLVKNKRVQKFKSSITPASKGSNHSKIENSSEVEGEIVDAGDHKIIDKSLVTHFSKNLKELYKNIGYRRE